ncbi:MAG: phenylacetate--CoA ligase [Clostridia bacterium]|nr:phenylacetate--CoA ligase [Clostridia bacterium]MBR3145605.1 phenylacetate--CoA ligase [Clostridia bacterium]
MNNYDIDHIPREELKKLQSERLAAQVKRSYERVECFRNRMDEIGLKPDDIKGVEDLSKLPFSYKSDLRDYYPFGLFAEPMENVVRTHASSGTTGKRIVVGYTKRDLDMWAECIARMLKEIGVGKGDIAQISFGYGLFTGGFGAHAGAEMVGATVVPMSSGNTKLQIQTMIDFGVTLLFCTPSYALYLAEEAEKMGVKDKLKLKYGIFGAEPWTEKMRKDIEKELSIKAYDIYGLSEVLGPGVACECKEQAGMHIREDNFIAEIIDPDTGEVLPEGSTGELVFTSLTKEAFPVIRYRTRDICSLIYEPCKCGCTHIRMNKPTGRSDDMLIIRGVNVFPSQIEEVLLTNGYKANYQIIVDRVGNTDDFEVRVEMNSDNFSDSLGEISRMEKELVSSLKSMLGIQARVRLVTPKSIVRSEGKAVRVIDKRKL